MEMASTFRGSHQMTYSQFMFTSFDPCHTPPILMGNHTYMNVIGKGTIDKVGGYFKDVLCAPHLSHNLLYIYQLTHGDTRRTMEFTPDYVFSRDLEARKVLLQGWLIMHLDYTTT